MLQARYHDPPTALMEARYQPPKDSRLRWLPLLPGGARPMAGRRGAHSERQQQLFPGGSDELLCFLRREGNLSVQKPSVRQVTERGPGSV